MSRVKPLSDNQIKASKPKDTEYKIADGDGLYLHIMPNGSKLWRLRYTINKKSSTKSLGKYPAVTLKDARLKRDDMRSDIQSGIKPQSTTSQSGMTFKMLVDEYFTHRIDLDEKYKSDNKKSLETHYYPFIEDMEVTTIEAPHIIQVLKNMEKKGIYTATKKSGYMVDRVFKYGVTSQYCKHNPMGDIDMGVLLKSHPERNFAHITDEKLLKDLLLSIDECVCDISTKTALQLMPYVFLRPANIRGALWGEFDFDKKLWVIPAEKMKMKRDHIIPLTSSMIKILDNVKNNRSEFVFPSPQSTKRQMSENTLNVALKRMGFKDIMTSHGFRHTASTFMHENLHKHKVSSDAIEMQLSHVEKNSVKGVYNKAMYLEERVMLMEWWSYYLDELKKQKHHTYN